jgi:hypothetical protein
MVEWIEVEGPAGPEDVIGVLLRRIEDGRWVFVGRVTDFESEDEDADGFSGVESLT